MDGSFDIEMLTAFFLFFLMVVGALVGCVSFARKQEPVWRGVFLGAFTGCILSLMVLAIVVGLFLAY